MGTSTPRCVAFGGEVQDGDKILETTKSIDFSTQHAVEKQMPGYKFGNYDQEDKGERFEEVISGWCVLSEKKPEERNIEFEVIDGGVGDTWIRWKITSMNVIHVMVWG